MPYDPTTSAYGTPAGFRAYHEARGRSLPAAALDDDQVTPALLVTSEWIDNKYRGSFGGYKFGLRTQVRDWPRYDARDADLNDIPSDSVPDEVIAATYEGAFLQLSNPGVFAVNYTPPRYTSARVEGAVAVTYAQLDSASVQTQFAIVDQLLSRILAGNGDGGYSALSGRIVR